ncbi:damage-control phosphatase ARMT1 family protein [Calothrix sp. NIES-3974]|uniref:damage-control phosphatase ARMT1 family protein n=1 Tax=Calothrix sp. NIES-3974 TaxID=2005462 RepID=UPI000B5EF2B4|nr:damage-control phosphatase ARMT1 family protein [Calothrix sp. NIES-3974]BAZ05813.1 hypothetical protein NIES3974_24680 [Calothrix sp. NIES-3974]
MTKKYSIPQLPLPNPLIASQDGSFTELTITQRMPRIARRVITENNFPLEINQDLEQLAKDLISGHIKAFADDTGTDFISWQKYIQPYLQKRWLDVPWFFAETYFYRYILSITNYFQPGQWQNIDPFALQKQQSLTTSLDSTIKLAQQVNRWLAGNYQQSTLQVTALTNLLYFSLWGNRVDLSLWSAVADDGTQKNTGSTDVQEERDRSKFDVQSQESHILVNNIHPVIDLLLNSHKSASTRVDFIIDNAAFELVCDLCLVDFFLKSRLVTQVKLHLKFHPTFVSDAMIKDVNETINYFLTVNKSDMNLIGNRLQKYIKSGRLLLTDNYFWTSPLAFWQLTDSLQTDLAESSLIIIKGDANYRRLLDDRKWSFTANIADIICYLPAPMVALRTLKSEIVTGIKPAILQQVQATDADWLTNGKWGLVQFVE